MPRDVADQQESGLATVSFDPLNSLQQDGHRSGREVPSCVLVTVAPEQAVRFLFCESNDSIVSQCWYADPADDLDDEGSPAEVLALGILELAQSEIDVPQIVTLYYDSAVAAQGDAPLRQPAVQTGSTPLLP